MALDSYSLTFETSESSITKTFRVAAEIKDNLDIEVVKSTKEELSLKVKASFKTGKERPQNVYAILQKDNQLPFQVQGYFSDGAYHIKTIYKQLISEAINGRYKLTVFAEDPRASNSISQSLKDVDVDI
jgi:C4-type Zn-finger protein